MLRKTLHIKQKNMNSYINSWLVNVLVVVTLMSTMIHQTISASTHCSNNAMLFNNGSTYQSYLNTLFRALASNATSNPSGFYRTIVGDPKIEAVYGQYLCRGDQNISSCHQCVTDATTTELPNTCHNMKVAITWYDQCMVRYSNVSFFNQMDHSFPVNYWNTNPITGNKTRFNELKENMLNNVIAVRAAEGASLKKFATDFANYTIFQTIYGLGQCTPDLSPSDCNQCLMLSIEMLQESPGGQVLAPSCNIRYEVVPFFNLSYLPRLPSSAPAPSLPPPQPDDSSNPNILSRGSNGKLKVSTKVLVAIIVAVIIFFAALFSACIYILKSKASKVDVFTAIDDQELSVESLHYDLATLLNATDSFSEHNKLGEGGFGCVYKGMLSNGKLIAVKRQSASSTQGIQEFKTEVLLVAKLQHRNLVRLLGFCYTKKEKLLVYEYVPNKSLDNFIFDHENRQQLDWQRRYNIIRGIARGLLYLHHDSQLRIIHRDLKASNILLDDGMNPKISDFGTSRIFGVDQSLTNNYTNMVVGTYGYMAPEYALHGQFSIKSDAYSLGVLVLEIISGKKASIFNQAGDAEDLLSYAWRQWEAGTPLEFVDPIIRDSCSNNTDVISCIQLGLLCVQESVEDRPTTADVVLALDSHSVTFPLPEQPDFLVGARVVTTFAKEVIPDHSSKSIPVSVNEDSVTELEPR